MKWKGVVAANGRKCAHMVMFMWLLVWLRSVLLVCVGACVCLSWLLQYNEGSECGRRSASFSKVASDSNSLCRKILWDSSANDFSMWSNHAALKTGARLILNFWDADVDIGKWKIPLYWLECIHFLQQSLKCRYQTFVTKIYNEGRNYTLWQ